VGYQKVLRRAIVEVSQTVHQSVTGVFITHSMTTGKRTHRRIATARLTGSRGKA